MSGTPEMTAAFVRSQLPRLDAITAHTQPNAHYLPRNLSGIAGLRTPLEPPDRTHVFFRYVLQFVPEELELDVPLGPSTEQIRRALQAEGVAIGRAEFIIPGMTLFREKRGYGKGCPWTGQYGQPIDYHAEEYPQAVHAIDSIIPIMGLTPPHD